MGAGIDTEIGVDPYAHPRWVLGEVNFQDPMNSASLVHAAIVPPGSSSFTLPPAQFYSDIQTREHFTLGSVQQWEISIKNPPLRLLSAQNTFIFSFSTIPFQFTLIGQSSVLNAKAITTTDLSITGTISDPLSNGDIQITFQSNADPFMKDLWVTIKIHIPIIH